MTTKKSITEENISTTDKQVLSNKETFWIALRSCTPVVFGYLPTGAAFGLMITSAGYSLITAIAMSLIIYAGAGQYLAVKFFVDGFSLIQMAIWTFLINTKHLFYGLSLLNDYKGAGLKKLYLMFALTDETYALLTSPNQDSNVDRIKYCLYVSAINHFSWIFSTFLGAALGSLIKFDISGMEFAMTALFVVILIDQLKSYATKIPFAIGAICAIISFLIIGKTNMLLLAVTLSVVLMIILKRRIEQDAHDQ